MDFRIKHAEFQGHNYFFSWEYDLTKDLKVGLDYAVLIKLKKLKKLTLKSRKQKMKRKIYWSQH